MGSIFSGPSVPTSYSPVTYVPSVSPTVRSSTSSSGSSPSDKTGETNASTDDNSVNEEEIIRDIIRRNFRGRNSTIQTSYRGVLGTTSEDNLRPQRKTLLGE